jgi:hypothetical protein
MARRALRLRGWALAFAVAVVFGLCVSPRAAADDPDAAKRARAAYEQAEAAARALQFAEALAAYRVALETDPRASFATVARAKVADLEAHAEGGFVPLARVERVRSDPAKLGDRDEIESLERDLEAFPPGRVRGDARLVVAESWWHRLGEPRRAIRPLERTLADPDSDRLTRALALTELVAVERQLGEIAAAQEVAARYVDLAPRLAADLRRDLRRARIHVIARIIVVAFLLLGLVAVARLVRRDGARRAARVLVRPVALVLSLYLGTFAWILIEVRGDGDSRPFLWLALTVLVVDICARAWSSSTRRSSGTARFARGATCATVVVATAFLIVERADASYLGTIGL